MREKFEAKNQEFERLLNSALDHNNRLVAKRKGDIERIKQAERSRYESKISKFMASISSKSIRGPERKGKHAQIRDKINRPGLMDILKDGFSFSPSTKRAGKKSARVSREMSPIRQDSGLPNEKKSEFRSKLRKLRMGKSSQENSGSGKKGKGEKNANLLSNKASPHKKPKPKFKKQLNNQYGLTIQSFKNSQKSIDSLESSVEGNRSMLSFVDSDKNTTSIEKREKKEGSLGIVDKFIGIFK